MSQECMWCPRCRQIVTPTDQQRGNHTFGTERSTYLCWVVDSWLKVPAEVQAAFQLGGWDGAQRVMMQKLGRGDG